MWTFNPFTSKFDYCESNKVFTGVTDPPSYTNNGDGSITFGDFKVTLYPSTDFSGEPREFCVAGATFVLNDSSVDINSVNYIVADYNGGLPVLSNITDVSLITESSVIPVMTAFRTGTVVHPIDWDSLGRGLANKIHQRLVKTQRFARESGLALSEIATRIISVADGKVWYGANYDSLSSSRSDVNYTSLYYHSGGSWTRATITQYNNTQYDDGTNLVALLPNRYAVNWVWRGVENSNHLYVELGNGDYTLAQAIASTVPPVPPIISGHGILVGRIIVQNGASTATQIDSAFSTVFTPSAAAVHGDLTGRDASDQHPQSAITNLTTDLAGKQPLDQDLTDIAALVGDGFPKRTGGVWAMNAGGGGVTVTETEIDFGTTPVYSKSFTITDASVSAGSMVVPTPSAKTATGRVNTDDMEWDGLSLAAAPASGAFTLYAVANPGPVVGKRKIQYFVG